ncbi:CDP-glucose 4,6-dehydratase [Brevundimonas sp. SL161]|uniref:CDP-glucose 4,6-dehydratase n=1 Tax=Brevundimonas sp. SL161 TaxID=2804613 RepID=UPI003CEF116F
MSGFWEGRRVLVTGHTGFKGSWLSLWLNGLGANVHGFALEPDANPSLFAQLGLDRSINHAAGDIRELEDVRARVAAVQPEVVIHLAAQSLVRRSYREPVETWDVNVQGSVHLLQALRVLNHPCAVVMVTTDKVYENREWTHAYRESDRLGGHDPYSASKAATELAVSSFRSSFFDGTPVRIASARAGNVIGGGDWSEDRLVPDLARALARGEPVGVRNAGAVRPWQHVLEPLSGYLTLARRLLENDDPALRSAFNFGPQPADTRTVSALVDGALSHWPGGRRVDAHDPTAPHEANLLSLTIDRSAAMLDWRPRWDFDRAVEATLKWYCQVHDGASARDVTLAQIEAFGAP